MKVFGLKHARGNDEIVPTPVGQQCTWCEEPLQEGEVGVIVPLEEAGKPDVLRPYHEECLAFLLPEGAHGGRGMTKRGAAKEAWKRAHKPVASDS